MSRRKCIFTGEPAKIKTKILNRNFISDQDELHNWTNGVPCSEEYEKFRGNGLPTELEMEVNECFHLLELARLRVKYYEVRLRKSQQRLKIENKHRQGKLVRKFVEQHKKEDMDKKIEQNPEQYIEDVLNESNKLIDQMLKEKND